MTQVESYRETVYSSYVSQKVSRVVRGYSQAEYDAWARDAAHRMRGWLPGDLDTPILDMGCGPGSLLYALDKLGYSNLTGVDLSAEQIRLAQQWCPRATIVEGDLRRVLQENPGRFGLIAGLDIIEHFTKEELLPLVGAVVRSLRPGGRLILQTPNAESPWGVMQRYHDLTHEIAFDPHSLQHILGLAGLASFEVRECGPYVHGARSLVRVLLWRTINAWLRLWNLAETGSAGSGVYSRVMIASVVKPAHT